MGGRGLRHGLALLLALAVATPAVAQQPVPTRQRPKHTPTATDSPTGAAPSRTPSPVLSTSPPVAGRPAPTGVTPLPTGLPAATLGSAVQSRWSRPAVIARTTSGQCRAQCALERNQCAGGVGDTSQCDPGWTRCLSACEGLSYGRGP